MRAREFIMKDAYSFHLDLASLDEWYEIYKVAYNKIFKRLGLDYTMVDADSGNIGGSKSNEFHVIADTGEDDLLIDENGIGINFEIAKEKYQSNDIKKIIEKYNLVHKKGIEVGHIFKLGDKYSKSLSLSIQTSEGNINPLMGCYGIGISRIIAASIEQNYDEDGIIFPRSIAPFEAIIIIIGDDKNHLSEAESLQDDLTKIGIDSIIDDRNESPGKKFKDADLTGIPFQLIVSEKNQKENLLELKIRSEGTSLKENKQNILTKLKP